MAKTNRSKPASPWRSLPAVLVFVVILTSGIVIFLAAASNLPALGTFEDHVKHQLSQKLRRKLAAQKAVVKELTEARQSHAVPAPADLQGATKESAAIQQNAKPVPANGTNRIEYKKHEGQSCQGYANGDSETRTLSYSKEACALNEECLSIECSSGSEADCTLRGSTRLVAYPQSDCYEQVEIKPDGTVLSARVHPAYEGLLQHYAFQPVRTQGGEYVNIILVRSPPGGSEIALYEKYKNDILFMGISSYNDYPLGSEFVGTFPGFLHMMREPEKAFPKHVKTILMSQSDFSLPEFPQRDYSVPKKYDFTYSASDCDVDVDGQGWCGWSKNWTFVRKALDVMCSPEFNLRGVLVATKNKANTRAYSLPASCKGKMIQTTYLARQEDYFNYLKNSRFALLPQVHDASPRVSTQALSADVPILMNYHIMGGWKYVNDKTGEFFHDMSDFKESLRKILKNSEIPDRYEPQKWVREHYGNERSGKRLFDFVRKHFSDRVKFPKGTRLLLT
mmetsp:Transcript_131436/g.262248  ORF Transcript_131436/g.262248 Transcript_131436/m.262248 type:complete len:507 (-) Transcript_131436:81-1601(-)